MGPDDLQDVIGTATIELPDRVENIDLSNADYLNATMMPGVQTISNWATASLSSYRLNILDQVQQMPKEEKRMMLIMLLDAFDDLIPEKTEAIGKILKVNRLKQILGKPKDSAL